MTAAARRKSAAPALPPHIEAQIAARAAELQTIRDKVLTGVLVNAVKEALDAMTWNEVLP